jgi:uncharacterized glyoxalase superfamily protein PhnB
MGQPRLNQVNLVVADMAATAAFYRMLGADFPPDAAVHAEAKFGALSLELDDAESATWWHAGWRADRAPRVVLSFEVDERDEVDARYAELTAAGHRGVQPPFDAFFGSRYAIVADPDGNEVAVMSVPEPSRRFRGWPPPEESPTP